MLYVVSSAAIAGGLVDFGNHAGRIHAIDAKTGEPAWQFQTDGAKSDPMKVVNDFEDMYVDFYRFASVGAIMSSPTPFSSAPDYLADFT